jgi:hypothetical protein
VIGAAATGATHAVTASARTPFTTARNFVIVFPPLYKS